MREKFVYEFYCSSKEKWDKCLIIDLYKYGVIPERENKYVVCQGFKGTQYIVFDDGIVYHYLPRYGIAKEVKSWNLKGYRRLGIRTEKDRVIQFYVHRLVALLFIPNPDKKPEVNHINRDKTDNRVENLEWVTKSENELHKWRTGKPMSQEARNKIGKANSGANSYKAKRVRCIETGEIFPTATSASLALGMSRNVVSQVCKNGKDLKGKHWEYI